MELLNAARENLWRAQQRFNYFPDLNVVINGDFGFNMNNSSWIVRESGFWPELDGKEPYIRLKMSDDVLHNLLNREMHLNNLELACLIEFDRRPNVYLPDFHTLMSFFHAPYPKDGT